MLLMVQKSRSQPPFGCIKPWKPIDWWLTGFVPSTVSNQTVFSRPVDFFLFRSTGSRDRFNSNFRWASPGSHEPTWIIWQDVSSEPKKKWTILCYQNPALKLYILYWTELSSWQIESLMFSCGFCRLKCQAFQRHLSPPDPRHCRLRHQAKQTIPKMPFSKSRCFCFGTNGFFVP